MSQPQGQSNNINAEMDCAAQKTDASLVGIRFSKDRAAEAVAQVMIPEALDYPL